MLGETITVITAGTTADPYSGENTAEDWTTATEVDVHNVAVEPRPSSEPVLDARNAVTDGFTLYVPTGTPITAKNRVRVRGVVYDVFGDPADWRSPTGYSPGMVVQIARTDG